MERLLTFDAPRLLLFVTRNTCVLQPPSLYRTADGANLTCSVPAFWTDARVYGHKDPRRAYNTTIPPPPPSVSLELGLVRISESGHRFVRSLARYIVEYW